MSRSAQKHISLSKNIKHPNQYVLALRESYKDWAFDELSAKQFKGKWRKLFSKTKNPALHLEIGPGNGKHFANLCLNNETDCFLAIELKYKALIQTIRRTKRNKSLNGKIIRYNARLIKELFETQELNNVYIHFPDPWLKKKKQKKHQLITSEFCKHLYDLQKVSSFLELKTDSEDYFHESIKNLKKAGYKLLKYDLQLHKNQKLIEEGFESFSQFELLFYQKNIPVKYALLTKE